MRFLLLLVSISLFFVLIFSCTLLIPIKCFFSCQWFFPSFPYLLHPHCLSIWFWQSISNQTRATFLLLYIQSNLLKSLVIITVFKVFLFVYFVSKSLLMLLLMFKVVIRAKLFICLSEFLIFWRTEGHSDSHQYLLGASVSHALSELLEIPNEWMNVWMNK